MGIDLNDFIRQIQKDNPISEKSVVSKQIILPKQTQDIDDERTPPRKMKYQPPTRNDYNEKEVFSQIPSSEMEDIKKTEQKLKKSKAKVIKNKRAPVEKISVECSVCHNTEEINNSIPIGPNTPHVCARCLKNANSK